MNGSIPPPLYEICNCSYLGVEHAHLARGSPYLLPGRAETALLRGAIPQHVALYSCEWGQLLVEVKAFRKRLKGLGKAVVGEWCKGRRMVSTRSRLYEARMSKGMECMR